MEGLGGQPEVAMCSTLLAEPRTVLVQLIALLVCVYVSILQVRPDLQVEEDEASRAMLKASIIFLANPCSLCTTILPILANGLQSGHLSGEFRWCLLSWPSCVMS